MICFINVINRCCLQMNNVTFEFLGFNRKYNVYLNRQLPIIKKKSIYFNRLKIIDIGTDFKKKRKRREHIKQMNRFFFFVRNKVSIVFLEILEILKVIQLKKHVN